ncbi:hypothetical protein F4813DRAFT_86092 [Daldinia decipiens]|uniref:uncharacterized protein n=1 Tax=Daldinia decipiens TaxID=326647 RepID=UPI0020C427A9|nr:uncharacterized protein F4813DRAFT_86092 [Daldinia decipiens]KAI1657334.1 hypothetical protein F4813DRAFT_86092 [Daldinia decipiens]
MAYNNHFQFTPRQPAHYLNHKVSDLSDSPYNDETSPAGIRGRESLVSLQSAYESQQLDGTSDGNAYRSGPSWSLPFVGSGGGRYQPVVPTSRSNSTFGRYKSVCVRHQDTIHEDESIDMSLLRAAAPPGHFGPYDSVASNEPAVDLSSFSGPIGAQDQNFTKSLQAKEARGHLTGGLGEGMSPTATIKREQLIASSSSLKRSFTRSFSMKSVSSSRSRAGLKELGQSEANRRGDVIEVIMEEPADLSTMVGPDVVGSDPNRRHSQLPSKETKTEVFYPQPNWKPFSMRWPYITGLILLSVGLAITQEILFQRSTETPLIKFHNATDLGPGYYFIFKFVPTIITVTYGVLWQNTDFEVKRLEAFYQLSKEGGALAAESVNVDYITLFNFTRPFRALQRRHYAVATSSLATLLAVSLVPTLGAAALVVGPDRQVRLSNPDVEKTITINPILSRLLTMAFFVIAVLGCVLFYQLNTRRSGLLSDVKGIAGLASMAVVSHIMMDFRDMDIAKPKDIHHKLKNRRYALRNSSLVPEDFEQVSALESDGYRDAHLPENPHPLMLRAEGCIPFIIGILMFLGFIPVFLFTPASVLTNKAPWVVTLLAVFIKLTWGSLETAIRMMEPYYILSKRHAPAKTLTLDYTAMPFAVVAARALFNRHWMVFLVGWGTIMVEALTIFVTSLATVEGRDFIEILSRAEDHNDELGDEFLQKGVGSGSETVLSFTVSLALTVLILIYLFIVATAIFIRRRHPFLPRQPSTIASVLAFVHQSKMLYDFVGTAKFTNAQMHTRLESLGKTYGLGWFSGRDGYVHCGVDEEELSGNYKHGVDFSQGNKPWLTDWQHF